MDSPDEELQSPITLTFSNQSIHTITTTRDSNPESKLAYQVTRDVTIPSQTEGSVHFFRVDHDENPQSRHLFYLVHPLNAEYRTDTHAYYITCVPGSHTVGNIRLETTSRLRKMEFRALVSANRDAGDEPLFAGGEDEVLLFSAKAKWGSGRYRWVDHIGRDVAIEDGRDGEERKLVVVAKLGRRVRDALVAVWVLRLWYDTAESRGAKRDGMLPALRWG